MTGASLAERLATRITAHGPLLVSEFVEAALYDERDGFYATVGRAGREGDFLTAPEVGPLFGAVIASAVDEWWTAAGRPDRWTVAEHGAGPGTLARAVLAAEPACLREGALVWHAVERSAAQRDLHPVHPAVVPTAPDAVPPDDGTGPASTPVDVVLANELLDDLPFDIVEFDGAAWREVRVGLAGGTASFVDVLGAPVPDEGRPEAPPHTRLPVQRAAGAWLASILTAHPTARIVVFDYAATTAELIERSPDWLRVYRGHDRPADWRADPGSCDITTDVDLDQLTRHHPPGRTTTQAAFLREHGIGALVAEGRAVWEAGAAVGDLAALRARSRIREAEALLDPAGMGGFAVVEWEPDGKGRSPLVG